SDLHARQRFQTPPLLGDESVELRLTLAEFVFARRNFRRRALYVALSLLQRVGLAIDGSGALLQSSLIALDIFATFARFGLPFLAEADELFLSLQYGGLAKRLSVTFSITYDAFRCLFG